VTTIAGGRTRRPIPHPSVADRTLIGRAAREQIHPSRHAGWLPATDRADPVDLLVAQNLTRAPDLVPIRHGRMMLSPFTFYRGAAKIMAEDLALTPTSGLIVQLCGDAHLSNFGAFASPERRLVFDLNDFDETLPGPFEYDVKRMAASFTIAARNNGMSKAEARAATVVSIRSYREAMAEFATMRTMDIWYASMSADDLESVLTGARGRGMKAAEAAITDANLGEKVKLGKKSEKSSKNKPVKHKHEMAKGKPAKSVATLDADELRAVKTAKKAITKAHSRDSVQALAKLGELVGGRYRIIHAPPVVVPLREFPQAQEWMPVAIDKLLRDQFRQYRASLQNDRRHLLERFEVVDVARKVVGVGSVGTFAFIVLLRGRDNGDPLFLQVKEATESVLEAHLAKSTYRHAGERVVHGQRLIQAASDIYLGWSKGPAGRYFYWRQLRDMKASLAVETMTPTGLALYGALCGRTLARAHARSGDAVAIAEYLGADNSFDLAVTDFSERYADQNERDYEAFVGAVTSGRIEALEGI
jgi:uncharacterized protein (DUF2252 family)